MSWPSTRSSAPPATSPGTSSPVEQERQQAAYQEHAHQQREAERQARAEEQRKIGLRMEVEQRYGPRLAKICPSFGKVYVRSCFAA
ncbi:hypothetical protein [Burkholderia cepacia]|uniref:hypothetical protein n=1 Tax=Burkholderia cepacia TaxID=292 RepID=UPI003EE39F6F